MYKLKLGILLASAVVGSSGAHAEGLAGNAFLEPSMWNTSKTVYSYEATGVIPVNNQVCVANFAVLTPGCAAARPQVQFYSGLCVVGLAVAVQLVAGKVFLLEHNCQLASAIPAGTYDNLNIQFKLDFPGTDGSDFSYDFAATQTTDVNTFKFHAASSQKFIQEWAFVQTKGSATGTLIRQ